ncbi:hypothetical protein H8E50_13730 [bacterium]|nr:hypothetical protein [bacterium]
MSADEAKTVQKRVWFGMNATMTIGPGFIHKAGFGLISLPHPPVINWLLRQGLNEDDRDILSFTHEFGHLQTMPLALFYTVVMLALASITRHTDGIEIALVLISTHAAWEIMAEIFTISSDIHFYRKCYEEITVIPRVIFWTVTGVLTVAVWAIILL